MNSTVQNISPLLDLLRDLMPPSHITLVGAGDGKGCLVQWLYTQSTPMTLVEAEEQAFETLQRVQAVGNFTQARLQHAVVAAEAEEVSFHTSSLAAESGLLPAEAVQQLWPNVQTLQVQQRQATSLLELLPLEHGNQWLLLDCLPAATLVQSAASSLSLVDVVLARVLLHTENKVYHIPGSGLPELAEFLPEFSQLALQFTLHPNIVYALLVRDYRSATAQALNAQAIERDAKQVALQTQKVLHAQLEQTQYENADLLQKQELQAQSLRALEADLEKITKAHATEEKFKQVAMQAQQALLDQLQQVECDNANLLQKQELQAQSLQALEISLAKITQELSAEEQAKETAMQVQAALQAQLQEVQQDNAKLLQKQEQQAIRQQALETDLDIIAQTSAAGDRVKEAAILAKAALQAQLEQVQHDNADLLQKRTLQAELQQALEVDFAKTAQARDAEMQAKKALQVELEALKAEQQDTHQRQAMLSEELYKAEVQLKLLEDLLLSDAEQMQSMVHGSSMDSLRNVES